MEDNDLGWWMIAGAVIAFIGYFIPGDYGVTYSPPAGNHRLDAINLTQLPHFAGSLTDSSAAVYSMHGGPVDFALTLSGIIVLFVTGWLTRAGLGSANWVVKLIFKHAPSAYSMLVSVAQFIWAFRENLTPPPIRAAFVKDLGGGPLATEASRYLDGNLGLGMLIVFFGLLVALIGVEPKVGCPLFILIILAVIGVVIYQYA